MSYAFALLAVALIVAAFWLGAKHGRIKRDNEVSQKFLDIKRQAETLQADIAGLDRSDLAKRVRAARGVRPNE